MATDSLLARDKSLLPWIFLLVVLYLVFLAVRARVHEPQVAPISAAARAARAVAPAPAAASVPPAAAAPAAAPEGSAAEVPATAAPATR